VAYAFDDVFYLVGEEALGEVDDGDGVVGEAVGLTAFGAGEVDVVDVVVVFTAAEAVFLHSCAVVDLVEEMVVGKETQAAKDGGAIHVGKCILDVGEGECL